MKLYNTLTKKKEEFVPLQEGKVTMYVCGPTVYNFIHIGNARPMIVFDTVRRYMEYKGYEVNFVSNFTDVDDKIIKKSIEEGVSAEEVSERYIKECKKDMADMNVNVISMEEAGITIDVVEDGKTFEENAMKKAVQVMEIGGKITLSDDSGLEIDYMDKAPGIYSARFMGEDTPYPERFKAIFEKLNDVPEEKRTARFVSCIAAAFPDGRRLVSYDTVEGIIGYEAKGENGFGYDPIFYVPEKGKYMAELSSEEKNAISHRGKALRKMKEMLKKEL